MEAAFDQTSVIKTLKDGIKKGYWTLEDLDTPSSGWIETADTGGVTQFGNRSALRGQPTSTHKNLLRGLDAKELTDLESMGTTKETEFNA